MGAAGWVLVTMCDPADGSDRVSCTCACDLPGRPPLRGYGTADGFMEADCEAVLPAFHITAASIGGLK